VLSFICFVAIINDKLPEFGVQLFNEVANALVLPLLLFSPLGSYQISSNLILLFSVEKAEQLSVRNLDEDEI